MPKCKKENLVYSKKCIYISSSNLPSNQNTHFYVFIPTFAVITLVSLGIGSGNNVVTLVVVNTVFIWPFNIKVDVKTVLKTRIDVQIVLTDLRFFFFLEFF